MRVLVNSLSAKSLSGKHVLYGHLRQLAQWTLGQHEYLVLSNSATRADTSLFESNVLWFDAPESSGWLRRSVWESIVLPRRMKDWGIDLYFSPSGTILPRSPVPQVTLAQNPWCLTREVPKDWTARSKALLQRRAYRQAQRSADLMFYNSEHIRRLYQANASGRAEQKGMILHQGISEDTHSIAARTRLPVGNREFQIVCVSVMAAWKNCETLLNALDVLRRRGVDASLRLIGGWPDLEYRRTIESTIHKLNLSGHVQIEGHVSQDDLHAAYRSSRVYCLLSRCESFGIPAIEAQAFGTPVVGASTGAMPEIGGEGGVFVDPDDARAAANALEPLLVDDLKWSRLSQAAIENADRFRWPRCSKPLLEMFSIASEASVTRHHSSRESSQILTMARDT
jgi:glycosyltransferase involved in cell wall biosynthesis